MHHLVQLSSERGGGVGMIIFGDGEGEKKGGWSSLATFFFGLCGQGLELLLLQLPICLFIYFYCSPLWWF